MIFSFRFLLAVSIAAALLCPKALLAGPSQRETAVVTEPVAQSPAGRLRAPPIIFFVAKGAANSCGEGCDSWIAAHGEFDSGSETRFKRLLARIGKRDLPIYFFSPGGSGRDAIAIGRLMRERKMRAGVARTIPTDCKDGEFSDSCNTLRRTDREVPSSLNTLSMCASACVYTLLGAPTRDVSANAMLAVHSAKISFTRNGRRLAVKGALIAEAEKRSRIFEAEVDRYIKSMGVDLALPKLARSVPHESSRALTREEIFRFGIDKRDSGDSGWTTRSQGSARAAYVRLFRKGWGGDGSFSEVDLRISCSPDGTVGLDYAAHGGADVTWPRDDIVVGVGSETINLRLWGGPPGSPDFRSAVVQKSFAMRFRSATSIWIAWRSGSKQTNLTPISLAGFADAMSEILPRCVSEQARPATPNSEAMPINETSNNKATPINELPASVRAAMAPGQPGTLPLIGPPRSDPFAFTKHDPPSATQFPPVSGPSKFFAPIQTPLGPIAPITSQKSIW